MKSFFLLLLATFMSGIALAGNGDFNIEIKVDGITGDDAILAYYYMDKKYINDTIHFDDHGTGHIKGDLDLPTGVYLLAFPSLKMAYFELILGEEKSFKLHTDTTDLFNNMEITSSLENQLLYANMGFVVEKGQESQKLTDEISTLEADSKAYKAIIKKLEGIDEEVKAYRYNMIEKHPDAYYSAVVKAMTTVELPENPDPSDSSYAYMYYRQHYFDNIDFHDNRLARTPFLVSKILGFLDNYTIPEPDSINASADWILEKAMVNEEMFQLCLVSIFNKYAKSRIMAHELVYVHLAKKYYISGIADWISEEQKKDFIDRINKVEPTLLGKETPQIIISDINGKTQRLHEIAANNDFTILAFWNSGCGHCKTEIPHLKEIFEKELAPMSDIEVFAISTELETDEWLKFIEEKELKVDGWFHAHDPFGRNPMRVLYNIESTPVILVIDRNLKIMAKRIGVDDIKGLLEYDIKRQQRISNSGE